MYTRLASKFIMIRVIVNFIVFAWFCVGVVAIASTALTYYSDFLIKGFL